MKHCNYIVRGALLALLFINLSLLTAQCATITVTSAADSGAGSLRQAIIDANGDTSLDDVIIAFNIPGSGVQTIAPVSLLPTITRPVTINGYTQPGASPNTLADADNAVLLIELSGANLIAALPIGLYLNADGCTVRGLVINRFRNTADGQGGIWVEASNNVIEGNFIGTDVTGTAALANQTGILISGGSGNQVGGVTPGSRNIVSGNLYGIDVQGGPNEVLGNYVGVGPDGATAVPNVFGIYLHYCYQVQIGSPTPGARNVISGNASGCYMNHGGSNLVQGNFIGTDVSGTIGRGNVNGVVVNESTKNLIGGPDAGAGNLISANLPGGAGVQFDGLGSSNNVLAGNLIGTDVTGTSALGNADYGVLFQGGSGNIIGGVNASARNVISASHTGVGIYGLAATNNAVLGNSIFGNSSIGIDLGSFSPADLGPTPNDPADADDGANHYQNFPEVTSVKIAGRNLKMEYRVDSAAANSAYPITVEFFIADAAGQGRTFISRATYTTPQALDNIVFKPVVLPTVGDRIVSTATDANGNTSEFSSPSAVSRQGQGGN